MILDLVVRPPGQTLGYLRPTVAQLSVLLAHDVLFFLRPPTLPDTRICSEAERIHTYIGRVGLILR